MSTVRVKAGERRSGAREQLGGLADDVQDALHEQLERYVGRELDVGPHVQRLDLEGRAVRLDFFVDTDGTLWIDRVRAAG